MNSGSIVKCPDSFEGDSLGISFGIEDAADREDLSLEVGKERLASGIVIAVSDSTSALDYFPDAEPGSHGTVGSLATSVGVVEGVLSHTSVG